MSPRDSASQEKTLRLPFILSLIAMVLVPACAGAQTGGPGDRLPARSRLLPSGDDFRGGARSGEDMVLLDGAMALPEGAIDPAAYVVGPGDRFELAIWGGAEHSYALVVSPEGAVFIPNVGVIDVAALTLADAREKIRSRVRGVFSNVDIEVVLSGLRRFKVHVVGSVPAPGAYAATAVTRVSEVVALAGGMLESASQRRVRLDRRKGTDRLVDLVAYELTGDIAHNPYVTDGAIIEVPRRTTRVLVSGAVVHAGVYEPRENERLSELLEAIGGLTPSADSTAVTLMHFVTSDETETRTFAYAPGAGGGDPVLTDGDAVFVRERSDWHRFGQAFVYGAVQKPGRHPIPVDGIRLSALIALAGGVTERANLAQAHVLRPHERFTRVVTGDELQLATPRDETLARQALLAATVDTLLVQADFAAALAGDEDADVLVRDGDIVQVPEDRAEVRVVGLVRRPGAYPFIAGLDVGDYIEMAGGYDEQADKSRIRVSPFYGAPARQVRMGRDVASGAIIDVPEKERGRSFIENLTSVTSIIVQAVSLVVLVDRLAE